MTFSCPLCASSSVELAGRTATYQSLLCHACGTWSTVPIADPRPPPEADAPSASPRRPAWDFKIK